MQALNVYSDFYYGKIHPRYFNKNVNREGNNNDGKLNQHSDIKVAVASSTYLGGKMFDSPWNGCIM